MPAPIISVENLSKRYLVGHRADRGGSHNYTALRDVIGRELRNVARKTLNVARGRQVIQGDTLEEFWALKDVSFEVQQGDVLGIVGRNGAGKSTLLKILSRITEPTEGRITLRGRVASLLEVGTGFHPELTGRENIYLNGAILGMSRTELRKKFDEIVAFAEVERFLDTPVKRYSSGMYVRLAFAVAAHLEPEILVIDEVLAVGDAEFQKKCLGKMSDVARGGRTVLFVSHNMAAVQNLCSNAILLQGGRVTIGGEPDIVVDAYLRQPKAARPNNLHNSRPTWAETWIKEVRLLNDAGDECSEFGLGESIVLELCFEHGASLRRPGMGVVIHHKVRGEIINVNTQMTGYLLPISQYSRGRYSCRLIAPPLSQGAYSVDLWLSDSTTAVDMVANAIEFSIHEHDIYNTGMIPRSSSIMFVKPAWNFEAHTPNNDVREVGLAL